jgi:hypothetical protein
MAMAEMACACSSAASGTASAAGAGAGAAIGWSSVNLRMKRRSIQSFQRQSRSPRA